MFKFAANHDNPETNIEELDYSYFYATKILCRELSSIIIEESVFFATNTNIEQKQQ